MSSSRVVVVTGANKGIGYLIVRGLFKLPERPTIVLTSRNEELGQEAVKKLLQETPDYKDSLHYHQLDIASDASADKFISWLKEKFGRVDSLVNNAGVVADGEFFDPNYQATEEAYNEIVGINYFKTRALTEKLLPLLSKDGKIINVSSGFGAWNTQGENASKIFIKPDFQQKDLDGLTQAYKKAVINKNLKEAGFNSSPYKMSKALLNAWTAHILLKQLKGDQQVFTVCPGWCQTDLGGDQAPRTAEQGADTPIYLVGLPYKRDDSINGKALRDREVKSYADMM